MAQRVTAYFYGTKAALEVGSAVEGVVALTLDGASWQSELEPGEGPGRIYVVEAPGVVVEAESPGYPVATQWFESAQPFRVVSEETDAEGRPRRLYHGTKAALVTGDLIAAGHAANFGRPDRVANFVYVAGTLDAAIWGAELAKGEGPGRIYIVEATGSLEDDPNLTNARFPGNPTKSYRSLEPLRVVGEVTDWQGHPPAVIQAMREGLERLAEEGVEPED